MNRKALILASLAVTLSTAAWCQGFRPGGPGPGPGGPMMSCPAMAVMPPPGMIYRMSGVLKLKHDQVVKLKSIAAKSEKTMRALQRSAAEASRALRAAVTAPKYDAKRVRQLASKAEAAEARLVSASLDAWDQFRSVLTAAQAARLNRVMGMPPGPGRGPAGPPPDGGGFPPPPGPGF